MNLTDLMQGQRYTFYYKTRHGENIFRANFLALHQYKQYKTLIIDRYESDFVGTNKDTIWYVDPNLVYKIETLSEIIDGKSKLPDDVLHVIDNFY